jgi:hypothetical protein
MVSVDFLQRLPSRSSADFSFVVAEVRADEILPVYEAMLRIAWEDVVDVDHSLAKRQQPTIFVERRPWSR